MCHPVDLRSWTSNTCDQEIMNDVADVLHEAADEGDEDSINTSDAAASGSQGRDSTQGGNSMAYKSVG